MKTFIKNTISRLYIALVEHRLLRWVNTYKVEQLKKQFSSIGGCFRIEFPFFHMGLNYIEIGERFRASNNFRLECWDSYGKQKFTPSIKIGDGVNIEKYCHIGCINKIEIGNNVLIASNVYISDHLHGKISAVELLQSPASRNLHSKGPVIIGDNVWIGHGVSIMPNVKIGNNSIVGANSVVTKSFPNNSIIAGVPAKIIKQL